jgi:hypothetical protein
VGVRFLKDLTTALNSKLNTDEKEQIKNKAKQQCYRRLY